MDRGTWILKCQNCGAEFEIEVKPGARIIEYAKEAVYPRCYRTPAPEISAHWHDIIRFRDIRSN